MKSMTGFGQGSVKTGGLSCTVEISSVNHKYFDIFFRMPNSLMKHQNTLKNLINEKISRGHIEVNVLINNNGCEKQITVNEKAAANYLSSFRGLKKKLKIQEDVPYDFILKLPDVFKICEKKSDEWFAVQPAVKQALKELLRSKDIEGKKISKDIAKRARRLEGMAAKIAVLSKKSAARNKKRLAEKVKDIFKKVKADNGRIYSEVSYMVEKSDITEEITRLRSHFKEFSAIMKSGTAAGRKLDFLIQEIMREINTAGSKSIDSDIAHTVVSFKEELEKIREQAQNIE